MDREDTMIAVEAVKPATIRKRRSRLSKQIERKGDAYYLRCKEMGEHPTISGLALALGYEGRDALMLAKSTATGAVKTSLLTQISRYEQGLESMLYGKGAIGAIFALKNLGWKDTPQTVIGIDNSKSIEVVKNGILSSIEKIEENDKSLLTLPKLVNSVSDNSGKTPKNEREDEKEQI